MNPVALNSNLDRTERLKTARLILKGGGSLKGAAHAIGWTSQQLDIALWESLCNRAALRRA